MADLTKMARTALGSVALAAVPASAVAVTLDTEPNSTFATAQPAALGDTIFGSLCLNLGFCNVLDLADFFHYTGLPPGGTFDLSFDAVDSDFGDSLQAGLYTDATTIAKFVNSSATLVHLTGSIPGSGELIFGITNNGTSSCCAEGYTVRLSVTAARVPAPAAIVLLAAGLTAVGLNAARRRKRS